MLTMPRAAVSCCLLLLFGCATVRAPISSFDDLREPGPEAASIEPQLELWLESGDPISDEEKVEALEAARAALEQAIERREISKAALGATQAVLVVREQGVSRTDSRRRDQTAATIGIVVGVVVIVAVVVAAIAGSKSGGGHSGSFSGGGGGGGPHGGSTTSHTAVRPWVSHAPAGPPRIASGPVSPIHRMTPIAPVVPVRPVGPIARPIAPVLPPHIGHAVSGPAWFYYPKQPIIYYDPFDFWLELSLYNSVQDNYVVVEPSDEAPPDAPPGAPLLPATPDDDEQAPPMGPPDVATAEEPPPPPPPPALMLPEPAELPLDDRGYFAGDETLLEVDLLDRPTGALLWSKSVSDTVDPRDGGELHRLLGEALKGQSWARQVR